MSRRVHLSDQAQLDISKLDRPIAVRILNSIWRFAETGAGNVKALHGIHPPEFRLRVGDWRVRFHDHGDWLDILRVRNRRDAY